MKIHKPKDDKETTTSNITKSTIKNISICLLALTTVGSGAINFVYNKRDKAHKEYTKTLEDNLEFLTLLNDQEEKNYSRLSENVESLAIHNLPINIGNNKTAYLDFDINTPSAVKLYTKEKNGILVEEVYTKNKNGEFSVTEINIGAKTESKESYGIMKKVDSYSVTSFEAISKFEGSPLQNPNVNDRNEKIAKFKEEKLKEEQEKKEQEKLWVQQEIENSKQRKLDAEKRLREEKESLLNPRPAAHKPTPRPKILVPVKVGRVTIFTHM